MKQYMKSFEVLKEFWMMPSIRLEILYVTFFLAEIGKWWVAWIANYFNSTEMSEIFLTKISISGWFLV